MKFTALLLAASLNLIALPPFAARTWGRADKPEGIRRHERAVPNSYIVVFKDDVPRTQVRALALQLSLSHGGRLGATYQHALRGFSVELPEPAAAALSRHPAVAYVEEAGVVELAATQTNAPWGLDRIDQRDLPLSTTYSYINSGAGVNAYVIDSGIRTTHQEFGGRAFVAFDNVGDGQNGEDCHGHGTQVAGVVGGQTFGVAKNVSLHSVRIFNCSNAGSSTTKLIQAIDFVTANHQSPAVTVLSVSTGASTALDTAVRNSISAGVTYAIAAGNNNINAGTRSPARVAEAITVGATDAMDVRYSQSNYGAAVDLFAPGVDVPTANWFSDTATIFQSGTSMAAAHVAGVVARYLSANPQEPPAAVGESVVAGATRDKVTGEGTGSPDRLLFGGLNGKIVFSRYLDRNTDIYVMNHDGSAQTRLTQDPAEDSGPAWSPDGRRIAFHSYRDGNAEIYVMDADGGNQTRLTSNDTDDYDPEWSPDGAKLVFTAMRNVHSDIYVMNADGTGQTRLTDSPAYDFVPSWSPDGATINFISSRENYYYRFYTMNADGTNQARLHLSVPYGHSWSPDSTRIVFGAYPPSGNQDLFAINRDGSGQTNLTNTTSESDSRPDWSPDGAKLAYEFYNFSTGDTQIALLNADGTGTKTVIATSGDDGEPDWQPLPAPPHALPVLALGETTLAASGGDNDDNVEPGEGGSLGVSLSNDGEGTATGVSATLSTSTPGVTVTSASSAYPDLAPAGGAPNDAPFTFDLAASAPCGLLIDFTLTVNYTRGATQLVRTFDFRVQTGQTGSTPTTISYGGPVVAIPDEVPAGVNIPISVSGFNGTLQDINFRFGGSLCTDAPGATTVGLDHTWLGDLVVTLTSPQGTSVVLFDREAGGDVNFCQTVFDDEAADYLGGDAPFTGSFKPSNPLSAFDGENPNGTWVLNVVDALSWDTGNVRAFSLEVVAFQCDN